MFAVDPKLVADEVFHWIVVPLGLYLANKIGRSINEKAKAYAEQAAAQALSNKRIGEAVVPLVGKMFDDRTPVLKRMMDDCNETLLQRINGTYVRTREQIIKDAYVVDRLDRLESRLDGGASK